MLTPGDRAVGHGIAAAWLVRAGETNATKLAEHWELAGERARAAAMWRRAAEQAVEGTDYDEAITRAERGVRCGAHGEALGMLRRVQAEAHRWRGDLAAAESQAKLAMQLLPEGSDGWADAATHLALAAQRLHHFDDLASVVPPLLAHLDSPVVAAAAARVAFHLVLAGERTIGEPLIRAAESAPSARHPSTRAYLERARAASALLDGHPAEFVERFMESERLSQQAGDLRSACSARGNVGFGLLSLGDGREAEHVLRGTIAIAQRLGLANDAANALQNLGWALFLLGRLEEAAAVTRSAATTLEGQGGSPNGRRRAHLPRGDAT